MSVAIFGLWRNWAVSVGFLTLLTLLAPFLSHGWLLVTNIVVWTALQQVRKNLRSRRVPSCARFMEEISKTILITTLVVAFFYIAEKFGVHFKELSGEDFTIDSPMLIVLISSPIVAIVCACFLYARSEPLVCQQCKLRYGNVIENGFVGSLFRSEWRYQTRLLMWLGIGLTIIDWGYYGLHYVNVNLNKADYFYFLWLPLAIYVLSLIYLGSRYFSAWMLYCQHDEGKFVSTPGTTTLRFLMINGDHIFINGNPNSVGQNSFPRRRSFDTPAKVRISYRERENTHEAQRLFESQTGIHNAEVRLIYTSPDPVTYQNFFHYFAFVDEPSAADNARIKGEWISLGELTQMINRKLVVRELSQETNRIYRVAMAWKTYDKEGRRLYNIKHYRPTFRLRDLRGWDVDYNDPAWIKVGECNEDSPMFRFNDFFKKLTRKPRTS